MTEYSVHLPLSEGVFNIVHDELGIVATITVTEEDDEMYSVSVDVTPL